MVASLGQWEFPFATLALQMPFRIGATIPLTLARGFVKTWVSFELRGHATPPHRESIAYGAI
jgi:hypothetical protein